MESVPIDDDVRAFLIESYENLAQIENHILTLEKTSTSGVEGTSTDGEILVRIYRAVHTIKGNCGFLPFGKLEAVAHASENLLGGLRDRSLPVTPVIISALLQTVDSIRQLLSNIEARGNEGDDDYSNLINTLTQLQASSVGYLAGVGGQGDKKDKEDRGVLITQNSELRTQDSGLSTDSSIRVDVELLDKVMNLVGELVLARNQILQISGDQEDTALNATCQRLNLITSELQSGVMKTRMQPLGSLWQKLPRVSRDLALACGKQVQVEMSGVDTELDKSIIEAIKDPLMHLIRNCIDHGIETPTVRSQHGKVPTGKLSLHAVHESGKVHIKISDDGSGINAEQLQQKALQLGLISPQTAAEMDAKAVLDLIFLPGLSTATTVTNLSGRGMGMDVVRTNIEKINGTVEVKSQRGQGTTFTIKIPLTLAIIPTLIVTSGSDRYAIPQASIQELVRLEGEQQTSIETLYDVPVLRLRGSVLPLLYLHQELQISTTVGAEESVYIVIIQVTNDYRYGLVVDAIVDTQDIVVKPLGRQLQHLSIYAGATILGDGKVALILDAMELASKAGMTTQIQPASVVTEAEITNNRQIMLLFDSCKNTRMAIPMSLASRLEEFPHTAVEKVGNQYVVRYRQEILTLIDLQALFSGTPSSLLSPGDVEAEELGTEVEKLQVVVVTFNQGRSIGLVVERIVDIVEEHLTIQGEASRPGVLSIAEIQGQITEILDVESIVRLAHPHFYKC